MANKEVFYQVVSGDKILPVYDVDAHNRIAAEGQALEGLSGEFKTFSGAISGKVSGLSGEFKDFVTQTNQEFINTSSWANETFQPTGDYVSASDFSAFQQQVEDALDTKVDKSTYNDFVEEARAWDNEFYTAGADIEISGHEISVKSDFVRLPYLQANYYDKDTVDEKIANFGGFQKASPTGADNHPDVSEPRTNIIYLVKVGTSEKDPYYEWIYDAVNGWECIGEMSVPLADYYTKIEADARFQPIGDYVSASDLNNYYTVPEVNDIVSDLEDRVESAYGDLFNTTLKAGTKITITTAAGAKPDDIEYTINADAPDIPTLEGESGISAQYITAQNKWKVGLERFDDAGFAKFSTSANTFATSAKLIGYHQDLNLNENKISLVEDKIIMQPGLYHVDMQITLSTTGAENAYYETIIRSLAGSCSDTKIIDASFQHSETVDLSYDIKIANDDTPLETTIEGFQVGGTATVNNLNIHEILQMPSKINGGGGNYVAGDGINIINDTVSVKIGDGLWVPASSNNLEVKLGKGLTFSSDGGINALTIDNKVEDVVDTVEKLSEDLDTKVTVNMPVASITDVFHSEYWQNIDQGQDDEGLYIAQLFSVPINNKLYVSAADAEMITNIAIYSHQAFSNSDVIFGLLEFDFDGNGGTGDTNWVADTGPVSWNAAGRHEFPLIHMHPDRAELQANKMYYAVACVKKGSRNNLWLAGTTGYSQAFNSDPRIAFGFGNCTTGTGENALRFDTSAGTIRNVSRSYNETCHSNPRFFMQIRNKKVPKA